MAKKAGSSIAGVFLWSSKDFNNLMSQLATIQAGVATVANRMANLQVQQNSMQLSLSSVQTSLTNIKAQEAKQMSALDDLTQAVQATQDLEQSAVKMIQGLAKQITDAVSSNDTAALTALAQQLNSSAAELGAAITANTPADPNAPQVNPEHASRR